MVTEGVEPSTVALLAQRSNQLSYATSLNIDPYSPTNILYNNVMTILIILITVMVKSLLAGRAGLCLHELGVEGLGEVDL